MLWPCTAISNIRQYHPMTQRHLRDIDYRFLWQKLKVNFSEITLCHMVIYLLKKAHTFKIDLHWTFVYTGNYFQDIHRLRFVKYCKLLLFRRLVCNWQSSEKFALKVSLGNLGVYVLKMKNLEWSFWIAKYSTQWFLVPHKMNFKFSIIWFVWPTEILLLWGLLCKYDWHQDCPQNDLRFCWKLMFLRQIMAFESSSTVQVRLFTLRAITDYIGH